jgi:geranylgeranyl diphosphate synthase type II
MIPQMREQIEEALRKLPLTGDPAELYDPMRYIIGLGGKRIRPLMVLLGNRLFGGKDEDALPAAMAIEMFHNFSLIHDDIMDHAPIRRGQVTVHEKWDRNIAILSGDALYTKTYQQLEKLDPQILPAVLKAYNYTSLKVCEGQQMDMNFESRDEVALMEYLLMIEYKTSALLGGALQIGGIIGGASHEDSDMLYTIGKNIGLSFQLKDDLLDAFGETEKVGKRKGGDIAANKKTALYILARQEASEEGQHLLDLHYGKQEEADIDVVLRLFTELGIPEKMEGMMQNYYRESLQLLSHFGTNIAANEALKIMMDQLMIREH